MKYLKRIMQQINGFSTIFFDVFDTVLKRNVYAPRDVFVLINQFAMEFGINDFISLRICAEQKCKASNGRIEVTLEEIYNYFPYSKEISKALLKKELEIEYDIAMPNFLLLPILKQCREDNKKIVLISDMYLSKKQIEIILAKCNIPYDYLYVSCEINKSKRKGDMFPYVLNSLSISPSQVLHIGDGIISDYIKPMQLGIKSILISRSSPVVLFGKSLNKKLERSWEYKNLQAFINNHICTYENTYKKFGYSLIGPMLYAFVKWLDEIRKKSQLTQLIFLSREGKMLLDAYKICFPDQHNIKYLYVSRHALFVASICNYNKEETLNKVSLPRYFTIDTIVEALGLETKSLHNCMAYAEIDKKKLYTKNTIKKDIKVNKLINILWDEIIKNSKEQNNTLKLYLKQEGMIDKIGLIDIGWKGTMQHLIHDIVTDYEDNIEINGIYMGLKKNNALNISEIAHGWLFDRGEELLAKEEDVFSFGGLLEILLSARHGSVKQYSKTEIEGIIPSLYLFEHMWDKNGQEKKLKEIQDGALEFIKDFTKTEILSILNQNSRIWIYNILKLGNFPKDKDIKLFKDFNFFDGVTTALFCKQLKINPLHLFRMIMDSAWKVGLMKYTFKIPFRYDKIYKIIKGR